jgi:hypothetical protein
VDQVLPERPCSAREHGDDEGNCRTPDVAPARAGDVEHGIPIVPRIGRITFDDAAKDLFNDYTVNGKKSHDHVKRRIDLALEPVFGGRRMISITTADIRAYTRTRLARRCSTCAWLAEDAVDALAKVCPECGKPTRPGAAPATINRELAALKRMFTLAVQAGKLHSKPYSPMLREDNIRLGFLNLSNSTRCARSCRQRCSSSSPSPT